MIFIPAHSSAAGAAATATVTTTTSSGTSSATGGGAMVPTLSTGSALLGGSRLNTTSTSSSSSSASFGACGGSRKTSMSDSQPLPPLLQQLVNGTFGVAIPDDECERCFQAKRHQEVIEALTFERQSWRIRERMKTASVALVLCLNIGVDPPDVVKIQPCARLECWIDPSSVSAPKAMELIGNNLQLQYERWQPRARYKKTNDPTVEDVKKLCTSLRRAAKSERILFHYNGHGVPKPTANGEIWVFNETFTQYIPLSIFELQSWMAAPSIYVYDCSNAGIIINSFHQFAEQHERDLEKALAAAAVAAGSQRLGGASQQSQQAGGQKQLPANIISYKNCIHLAACSANEILPMNAQLPADLFTSCLTTPINIALKWYAMQEKFELVPRMHADLIDKIPGKVNNRRTMMGELNWIFTAITDTIAWNTLPRDLFQRLFRQDMLVASLFRNFLLAERILKSHDCVPVSHPSLPSCHRHPMWSAWDLVVDLALQQLPEILERGAAYKPLPFFEEQLTAFQVWLDRESESRSPPEQLPIVLQVLLSQVHRLRALELLARFLDLGPWAVNFALGVGIFPYVLKLLISPDNELRPVLVFIWAKILAVDPSCQVDLVKEHKYFLAVLQDPAIDKEHRTMAAFVLASIVNNFLLGQTSALQGSLVSICLEQLNDQSWLLRQWLAICLGMLWQNFEQARWSGVRDQANEKLLPLLKDPIPEVRAAAVFALGTFISSVTDRSEEHANHIDRNIAIMLLDSVGDEMSPLVRLEIVNALQWMVLLFVSQFVTVYMHEHLNNPTFSAMTTTASGERSASVSYGMGGSAAAAAIVAPGAMHHSTHSLERHVSMRRGVSSSSISNMSAAAAAGSATTTSIPFQSFFVRVWQGIYNLSQDPFPKVAETAQKIVGYVRDAALDVITAKEATSGDKGLSASVSLPPSPNTRVNYLNSGESPPVGGGAGGGVHHQGSGASNWAARLRNNAALIGGALSSDPHTLLQRKMRSTSMNDETDSSGGPTSLNLTAGGQRPQMGAGVSNNGGGDGRGSARSSTSEGYPDSKANPKQIVATEFIPWAISYFTRPGKQRYASATEQAESEQTYPVDENSPELRTRFYRYQRNRLVRRRAREEKLQAARIDTQTWVRKAQYTPSIVRLLPYEPQIAVAYREKVRIHDWTKNSQAAVKSFTPPPPPSLYSGGGGGMSTASSTPRKHASSASMIASSSPPSYSNLMGHGTTAASRVSTMEFLNAQDVHMVLVGHEDGIVRIWQAAGDDGPRLITAWEGLPVHHSASGHAGGGSFGTGSSSGSGSGSASLKNYRKDPAAGYSAGIVTAWQQCSQQLIVGGLAARFLRVWDVHKELKVADLPLGAETNVRALAPLSANLRTELLAAGCADGSVLLFDKRCSVVAQEARIRAYRDHTSAILTVCLKENQTTMVTGCSMGRVCVSDLRARGVLHQWEAGTDITAIASHQSADMVACGSANKITVYSQAGRPLSTLRSNEGFMVPKIGHPTCLSFHPYRVMLAAGFLDNTVAIYEPATAATPTGLELPCFFLTYPFELSLQFYKLCNRWKIDVDKNPETFDNARRFLDGPEIRDAIAFMQRKTQLREPLTAQQAQLIYTICAFETAWERRRPPSVWCSLFTGETIKALEFAEDLEYYWNDGYGYELTHKIACPAIGDMFEAIDPLSAKPNATFYFTHSGTVLKMLAHLRLYKDAEPLTYKDYQRQRLWRTSAIDAFASNIAFVLYECDHTEPMVLTLHQERPVRLAGCPATSDLCPLQQMRKVFADSLESCDFQALCAAAEAN